MKKYYTLFLTLLLIHVLSACNTNLINEDDVTNNKMPKYEQNIPTTEEPFITDSSTTSGFDISIIPEYNDEAVYIVNNNIPFFTENELTTESYEIYADLDSLGRCGVANACLSKDTMPKNGETRGEIGSIKPAGWHTVKYPDVISDLYLYNRCHLIGWQLGAENANKLNLTTGTRYLNVEGMLPYENMVDNYIEQTNNHVMYRITPVFIGDELVCRGILMEAKSVEDDGCIFCVYCYNVQPGIYINYLTGESYQMDNSDSDTNKNSSETEHNYILNTSSMKIHNINCKYAASIGDKNRCEYTGTINDLINKGYSTCKSCNPD